MNDNYSEILESYLIPAEEGFFSKIKEKFRKSKKVEEVKKPGINYQEYYKYLNGVYSKIPSEDITKEKTLRKKEFNILKATVNSELRSNKLPEVGGIVDSSYELQDFLNCKDYSIFETEILSVATFNGYKYMEKKYPNANDFSNDEYDTRIWEEYGKPADKLVEKLIYAIKSKKLVCFTDPEDDWDKFEGYLWVNLEPSKEFMEVARMHGYLSAEDWNKQK